MFGLCLLAAIPLAAQQQQTMQPADPGMQAAVGENGQLRQPTAAEMQALAPATNARPTLERAVKIHAYGITIALDASFDHTYVVRTDEEGNFVFHCTDDHDEAAAFVARSAAIDTMLRIKPAERVQHTRLAERE